MVVQRPSSAPTLELDTLPLTYLAQLVGHAASERVLASLAKAGHGRLTTAHGYLVQRLLEGPATVTALARQLGISQQAASKHVSAMRRAGAVRVVRGADARERQVALTARGLANVEAARRARAAVERSLVRALGERRARELRRSLRQALHVLGGEVMVRDRKVRPLR